MACNNHDNQLTMTYSEFKAYSEPCQIYTMDLLCKSIQPFLAEFSIHP